MMPPNNGISFWGDKLFQVLDAANICTALQCTKCSWIFHLKMISREMPQLKRVKHKNCKEEKK
jgi:hypothetical protein